MSRNGIVVGFLSLTFASHLACKTAPVWEPAYERPPEIFYGSVHPHRVTVETANGLVSVIDVPVGVLLSVKGVDSEWDTPVRGPHRFRGDLVLRTRRSDELDARERFGTPDERQGAVLMDRSQFVLTLRDVDMVVETIR